MTEATASEASAGAAEAVAAPRPQKVAGVIGISAGILAIVALLGALAFQRGDEIDGTAVFAEVFRATPDALGYRVEAARSAPGGMRFVKLVRAGEPHAAADRPAELMLGLYGSPGMAMGALQSYAGPLMEESLRKWKEDAAFAFRAELERGDLDFGAWRAPYTRARQYDPGQVYRDEVRVDLSNAARGVSLRAVWPDGRDGTKKAAEALLAELDFVPAPAPAAAGSPER